MYICRALVKHGVTLVGGASAPDSLRHNFLARTSDASTSASAQTLFSVRALASSFPHFGVRQAAPYGSQMQRRSAGDWRSLGASLVGSRSSASDRNESSASVSLPRSGHEGVEFAQENSAGAKEAPPKFDVSSNCVTPVFRVSPFIQKTSVIFLQINCMRFVDCNGVKLNYN